MRWVLLTPALLAGCAMFGGDDSRRQNYVQSRASEIPSSIRGAIIDGNIMRGMTKDEVRASWGDPCGYCYGTKSASWGDTWEYNVFGSGSYGAGNGTYVFFDQADRVTGWSGR